MLCVCSRIGAVEEAPRAPQGRSSAYVDVCVHVHRGVVHVCMQIHVHMCMHACRGLLSSMSVPFITAFLLNF